MEQSKADTNHCDQSECQCDGPGFCSRYGVWMSENLYTKCKSSEVWRANFDKVFEYESKRPTSKPSSSEEAPKHVQERPPMHVNKLDELIKGVAEEGVNINNYDANQEGLGDLVDNVLSKLGITEETVEKWSGIRGCGCSKRKKFLNKILPFRKKE